MAEVPSTQILKLGQAAPGFRLPDGGGRMVELGEVMGERGVLVAFVCNHCPFVVHLAGALGEFGRELHGQGVGMVAINSNDVKNYPADAPELMVEFARAQGWDFPYLYDETQDVARAYHAACTPDFFLFDGGGGLFYAGQFDGTRPGRGVPDGGDLRAAVAAMLAGEDAPERQVPSTGCNIKWVLSP
jgi:peroxiredoxin